MNTESEPLVCICIPTYNAEMTIAATLNSLLNQTYQNFIIHIVDNNSSDNTLSTVDDFNDERLTIHRNATNIGGEGNFNRCIDLARGKYTSIYHSDDIYEPQMIAAQVMFLEKYPQAGAVFTEALLIDDFDKIIGEINQPRELAVNGPLHHFQEVFKAILEHSNFLICPSAMVRTHIYKDETIAWRGELFGSSSDLDVWLRILLNHPVGILPQLTMRYRISKSQWSANVRSDSKRAAIFNVLDHYIALEKVRCFLLEEDIINYQRLKRRDNVMRAVNALIQDKPELAEKLCTDIFSIASFKSTLQTRRGLAVFILGLFIKVTLFLHWTRLAKIILTQFKRLTNK